ncbi:MAG TPA: AAC(3) family N-acetyltransferase [Phycisphaerae bacterium]|nr:AAC(3) family N-acetyltransferase [Phycisphaerae bacterium]
MTMVAPVAQAKRTAKRWARTCADAVGRLVRSTTPAELTAALRGLGIRPGQTMTVHSSFDGMRYFKGTPFHALQAILDVVGPQGTVVMPTFSFDGRSYDYLRSGPSFDLRRTPAQTGLICELLRRRKDAIRSLSPTHSVAAVGPLARMIVSDHENSLTPFDEHSPWRYLLELNAWMVFVGVPDRLLPVSAYHHFDELLEGEFGVRIYHPERFEVRVLDGEGRERCIGTYAHDPETGRHRDYDRVCEHQARMGVLKRSRVGAISLWGGQLRPLFESYRDLAQKGIKAYR